MEIHQFAGIRFVVTENIMPVPRMQVSPEFARIQSPDLVAKTNAWMEQRFGCYYPMYAMDQSTFRMGDPARGGAGQKVIAVHVSDWENVKAKLKDGA